MEKEFNIKNTDCIDFLYTLTEMTKKGELAWVNINTLVENYRLDALINESANGVTKFSTHLNDVKIILGSAYFNSDKLFNIEFFPDGDQFFYRMPSQKDKLTIAAFERLEEIIWKQIKNHDTEKIAKIMGIQ